MKFRIILTVTVFILCIWSKYSHTTILGMDFLTYKNLLKEQIELNSFDFTTELPYTLYDTEAAQQTKY